MLPGGKDYVVVITDPPLPIKMSGALISILFIDEVRKTSVKSSVNQLALLLSYLEIFRNLNMRDVLVLFGGWKSRANQMDLE